MKRFTINAPDYIYKINPYIPGKPIEEVEREKGISNIIKLASNENPMGPSPLALKAIKSCLKNLNRYPDGSGFYLKRGLADFFNNLGKSSKTSNLAPGNFILGNGSNELIDIAVRTFCGRDENIVAPFPSFVAYYLAADQSGLSLKISGLRDFCIDLDDVKKLIDAKTRVVFISNPNNPTGTFLSNKKIIDFARSIREDILVVVDEAYVEYCGKSLLEEFNLADFPNILILRTFSKAYGLAGLRAGYGIGHKDMVALMERVREPFNVNSLSLSGALGALDDQDFVAKVVKTNEREKLFLYSAMKKLGIKFVETGANFILCEIKGRSANEASEFLLNLGVIVRPMDRFGYSEMIRITIGKRRENIKLVESLEALVGPNAAPR